MVALVVFAGVRTPVCPADAVVVALLANRSIGDRLSGALLGWLLFAWWRGGDAQFLLSIRWFGRSPWAPAWVIDSVRAWTERTRNETLFEVAAALAATVLPSLISLAMAFLLSASGMLPHTPMPLGIWWGGATAAFAIFLPPLLYLQRDAAFPAGMLSDGVFAAVVVLFSVGAVAATALLPEPMVFFVVPLLLAGFVLRPVDMAILSGTVWFATMMTAFGLADAQAVPLLMPLGIGIGTLLPIATSVLVERLRLRERDLRRKPQPVSCRAMDDSSIGVTVIGADLRYISVNAAFCAMMGYEASELIGRDLREVTFPDDRDDCKDVCADIRDGTAALAASRSAMCASRARRSGPAVSTIVIDDPLTGKPDRLLVSRSRTSTSSVAP